MSSDEEYDTPVTHRHNTRSSNRRTKPKTKDSKTKNTPQFKKETRRRVIKPRKMEIMIEETETDDEDYDEDASIDIEETDDETDEDDFVVDEDDEEEGNENDLLVDMLKNAINRKLMEEYGDDEGYTSESSEDYDDRRDAKKPKKKQEKLYRSVKNQIRNDRPSVQKLLQMDIPFKEMCDLFEQIKTLDTLGRNSLEYIAYKRIINANIEQFTKSKIDTKTYEKYDSIEEGFKTSKNFSVPLKYRILSSNMSDDNKRIVYEKFCTLKSLENLDSSDSKMNDWIEWALSIPTDSKKLPIKNRNTDRNEFLSTLRGKLDDSLEGMAPVKEEIMCIVNNYLTDKNGHGNGMGLVGSPGIGKTTIVRTLAECLDLPFQQISLGGVKDSSYLTGHSYTYEGAKPGAIVDALRRMEFKNGIIFFDEFDKLADTPQGKEVANVLLHITDPAQNHEFRDIYLSEYKIDLSNIWFIYSMNNESAIDPVLRDRIPIIKLKDYTNTDKINIFHNHLFPSSLQKYNYTEKDISIDKETTTYMIEKIRKEHGVRELKRSLDTIVKKIHFMKSCSLRDNTLGSMKMSFDLSAKMNVKNQIVITKELVDTFIKMPEKDTKHLSMYL
jgi:ATP-dependent Lon protease